MAIVNKQSQQSQSNMKIKIKMKIEFYSICSYFSLAQNSMENVQIMHCAVLTFQNSIRNHSHRKWQKLLGTIESFNSRTMWCFFFIWCSFVCFFFFSFHSPIETINNINCTQKHSNQFVFAIWLFFFSLSFLVLLEWDCVHVLMHLRQWFGQRSSFHREYK